MSDLPKWVTVKESPLFPKWKVVKVEYMQEGDPCWNASVNIYVKALDKQGVYQPGIKMIQAWPDGSASDPTKLLKDAPEYCGQKFGTTFVMSGDSSFDPGKGQVGPYTMSVEGNSDQVTGLGLPLKRHNQYLITWQFVDTPTPPPQQGHWTLGDYTNHDNPGLRWVTI